MRSLHVSRVIHIVHSVHAAIQRYAFGCAWYHTNNAV